MDDPSNNGNEIEAIVEIENYPSRAELLSFISSFFENYSYDQTKYSIINKYSSLSVIFSNPVSYFR